MARDPHDEALSWGDENDPTYVPAHPAALDEDDLESDIPVVDPFSSSAVAPPLPPAAAQAPNSSFTSAPTPAPAAAAPAPSPEAASAPRAPAAAAPGAPSPAAAAAPATKTSTPTATPTATPTPTPTAASRPPTVAEQAEAAEDAAAERDLAAAEKETRGLSSAALITFGIFGGIFLLYTVGWLVTYIRNPTDPSGLAGIVQNAQNILAIAAPALWFVVTLLVGAKRKVPVRIIWLVVGFIVLLPWPFLTGN